MLIKKYSNYIFFLLFCLLFTNCEFLEDLFAEPEVVIEEPEDGLETTASKIDVSGYCSIGILSDDEINVIDLSLNNVLVDSENYCGSFRFSNVTLPNGDIQIKVTGYYMDDPNYPGHFEFEYVAGDSVSIFCDNTPPTIIINTPRRDKIIFSSSVTFIGSISDIDEVKSFTYVGKHGHNGNITIKRNRNWYVTIDNLPYEYQYVTFRAEDRLGNINTKTVYFTCSE